jgi:chorismate synthase
MAGNTVHYLDSQLWRIHGEALGGIIIDGCPSGITID